MQLNSDCSASETLGDTSYAETGSLKMLSSKDVGVAISQSVDREFVLLIERGQTRFPERPIHADRFLIGAGSNCHLQLGGEMPLLHSIVIPEGNHLWIDAVVAEPALYVNRQAVREAELHEGDLVEIGNFVFCVALKQQPQLAEPPVDNDVEKMSAGELVDALEQELEFLSSIAAESDLAAASMMQAAQQVQHSSPASIPSSVAGLSPEKIDELARLLQELRCRAEALDYREEALLEHARQLEMTQQELQRQLQRSTETATDVESNESASLKLTA